MSNNDYSTVHFHLPYLCFPQSSAKSSFRSLKGNVYTFVSELQILFGVSFLHQWTIPIACSLVIRDWELHLPTSYLPEPPLASAWHRAQLPPSHRHSGSWSGFMFLFSNLSQSLGKNHFSMSSTPFSSSPFLSPKSGFPFLIMTHTSTWHKNVYRDWKSPEETSPRWNFI